MGGGGAVKGLWMVYDVYGGHELRPEQGTTGLRTIRYMLHGDLLGQVDDMWK